MIFALLFVLAITIPPATKVLAVVAAVYVILQALKKVPGLANILNGWVAIAFNVVFSVCGLLVAIPADQLYTMQTFTTLLTTILAAAGIHGTVTTMSNKNNQPPPSNPK